MWSKDFIRILNQVNEVNPYDYFKQFFIKLYAFKENDNTFGPRSTSEIIYSLFLSNSTLHIVFNFLTVINKNTINNPSLKEDIEFIEKKYEKVVKSRANYTKYEEREIKQLRKKLDDLCQSLTIETKVSQRIKAANTFFSKILDRLTHRSSNTSILMENIIIEYITLPKLIEKLIDTREELCDNIISKVIYTYDHYISEQNLMLILINHYMIPRPLGMSEGEYKKYRSEKIIPIKKRILMILKFWIDERSYDYEKSPNLKTLILCFLHFIQKIDDDIKNLQSYKQILELAHIKLSSHNKIKSISIFHNENTLDERILINYSEDDIAKQLTSIDSEMFCKIPIYELMDKRWDKLNNKIEAPNYFKYLQRSNDFHYWILYVILKHQNDTSRQFYVTKFIKVALLCEEYHNYATMHSIFSALFKLNKLGLFSLNKENTINWNKLKGMFERDDSVENLMTTFKQVQLPAVPALWVYIRALQKCQEFGFYIKMPENNLKYIKYQVVIEISQIIKDFRRLQGSKYCFSGDECLYQYLKKDFKEKLQQFFNLNDKIKVEKQIAEIIENEKKKRRAQSLGPRINNY